MHCLKCGAVLAETVVLEHGRPSRRLRCAVCDYVHYNNPTPVVGCIVEAAGKGVLLVQVGCSVAVRLWHAYSRHRHRTLAGHRLSTGS